MLAYRAHPIALRVLLALTLALGAAPARPGALAQIAPPAPVAPYLVREINPAPEAGTWQQAFPFSKTDFEDVVQIGATRYLIGQTAATGLELWRSDGTAAGTRMVKDLAPGPADSGPKLLAPVGDLLIFFASDGADNQWFSYSRRLWRSDGTEQGTFPLTGVVGQPGGIVVLGSVAYFTIATQDNLSDKRPALLWRSDGTPQGTYAIPAASGEPYWAGKPAVAGGLIYFSASDAAGTSRLWRSDGSSAGTYPLLDDRVFTFLPFGDRMILSDSWEGGRGRIWISDGSRAGTQLLAEGWPRGAQIIGDQLFFTGFSAAYGDELWVTDGTPAGTHMVADSVPGPDSSEAQLLGAAAGLVYFKTPGDMVLWRSDGSAAGTRPLATIPGLSPYDVEQAAGYAGRILIATQDALWASDGTPAGTLQLGAFVPRGYYQGLKLLGATAGHFFFSADDGVSGLELWATDGTPAGTRQYADLEPDGDSSPLLVDVRGGKLQVITGGGAWWLWEEIGGALQPVAQLRGPRSRGADPEALTVVGARAFFSADDGVHGRELWVSDGTEAGTALARDIRPGPEGAAIEGLVALGDQIFFLADDGVYGRELWVSDGTEAGTALVRDLGPGTASEPWADEAIMLGASGGHIFVWLRGSGQIWRSDGTADGTFRLLPIESWAQEVWLIPGGAGTLIAVRHAAGVDLWLSDGALGGTQLLATVGDLIDPRLTLGGRLIFRTAERDERQDLWVSDGTPAGTQRLSDQERGPFKVSTPVVAGDHIFFIAADPAKGRELWGSDGTPQGTQRLTDLPLDALYQHPECDPALDRCDGFTPYAAVGGRIFFMATTPASGSELWVSDGTPQGTFQLRDINPGPGGSIEIYWKPDSTPAIGHLTAVGSRVFWLATSPSLGLQIWTSDGTRSGTRRLTSFPDMRAEGANYRYHLYLSPPERFFFQHDDELWVSDGSAGGTRLVRRWLPELDVAFTHPGGRMILAETYENHGSGGSKTRFWLSDGSAAGTTRAPLNIYDHSYSFPVPQVATFGDTALLPLDGLWASDGTVAGTRYLLNARLPTALGDTLLFVGTTVSGGAELWAVPRSAIAPFPTTPALDAFARRDGPLSLGWQGATGGYRLRGEQLVAAAGGPIYWPTRFGERQEAFVTLAHIAPAGTHSLLLKVENHRDVVGWRSGAIRVSYDAAAAAIRVATYQPGRGWQQLARWAQPMADGDTLGALALPDGSVEVYRNGSVVGVADTSATNPGFFGFGDRGRAGLWLEGAAGAALDDFGGGSRR